MRATVLASLLMLSSAAWAQTPPNYTATWFNPSESGWGMTIAHQGDVLFPAWYTYNSGGQIQWYIVSGASKTAAGTYVGPVFRFTGRPFNQINGTQAFQTSTQVGNATIAFPSANAMTFNYTVDGITQTKTLSRFVFGAAPVCTFTTGTRSSATNYSDIWNLSTESGWGITLDHQGDSIFAAWYTYAGTGNPQWITGLATRQADGSFKGDLNRPSSGVAFNQINGAPATTFPVPKVGDFELSFSDGENASFKYRLDNIEQTKSIRRFTFASPVSVCAAAGTGGGGGGGGGSGNTCYRVPQIGDQRTQRSTAVNAGQPNTVSTITERTVADGPFEGTPSRITETYDEQNRRISRRYEVYGSEFVDILAIEAFDPASGQRASITRYTPPQRFPLNPTATTFEVNYTGVTDSFIPVQTTATQQFRQRLTRLPDETITTPLGTFTNACKVQTETRGLISVQGFNLETNIVGPTYSNGTVGPIKSMQTSTTTGVPGTTQNTTETLTFTPGG